MRTVGKSPPLTFISKWIDRLCQPEAFSTAGGLIKAM